MEPNKYNIRQILAAGGVILSLVFVGIEIQQNTNAVKATAVMEYYSSSSEHYALMVNNPELARVIGIVFDDPDKLTQQEKQMYIGFVMAANNIAQSAYRLWTMGVLPDEEWNSTIRSYCPGENSHEKERSLIEMMFNELRDMLLPSFAEVLESACGFNNSN